MDIIILVLYIVIGITSYVTIHYAIYFIFSREKENMLFSLTSLFVTVYNFLCIQLYRSHSVKEGFRWQSFQLVTLSIISIFLLWFIIVFTKSMLRIIPLALTIFFASYALIVLIFRNSLKVESMVRQIMIFKSLSITYYEGRHFLFYFQFIIGLLGQFFNFYLIYIFFIRRRSKESIYLLIGFFITLLTISNDALIGLGLYKFIYTIEYGYLSLIFSLALSISSRQIETKNRLMESRAQLNGIASSIPSIVFQCILKSDNSIKINYMSRGIDALFGININKPDYEKLHSLIENAEIEKIIRSSINVSNSEDTFINEFRYPINKKKTKWIRSYSNPRRISNEEVLWNGIMMDITEKKSIEEERELLIKQLNQKTEELNTIIHIASHDLRSPLVNIHGFSNELKICIKYLDGLISNIKMDDDTNKRIMKILETDIPVSISFISGGVLKLERLLNCLVELSVIEKEEFRVTRVDMNMIVKLILDTYQKNITENDITVELKDLPDQNGDEKYLSKLFTNLIDNAIKFLDTKKKGLIRIYGEKKDKMNIYYIEDNGIGIEEEHLSKIFDLFYKYSLKKESNGSGFGLFMANKIVYNHNGFIKAESTIGKGTKFQVNLPA